MLPWQRSVSVNLLVITFIETCSAP